jgi:hypothetical protein
MQMAGYLLMVMEDEGAHASAAPKATAELIDRQAQFADSLRREGKLKDAGRLRPSKDGKRVRRASETVRVEGGPFGDERRALGAYYWIEAGGVDEAAEIASRCPTLAADEVDVRPLMKGNAVADKESKPGKVFAFAVLGNTPTEEAWVAVMDRIDAASRDHFPKEGSLGGVRLEPPTRGRRVATRAEKRAMFDGPFLESKEVIGGVFFLRMTSLDEAVEWAATSPFVAHGALEIRELWRS